ncbi:MAG: glycosyl transferase [Acidobacteriaceae bacterium]|nr:glycosyl transferase [Acidobacteriaceae bacterium]
MSWYITRGFVLFALERHVVDVPSGRSSHSFTTPRGGGVSFVLVLLGATVALAAMHRLQMLEAVGLLAAVFVALVGYFDDCGGLSIRARLLVHFAASGVALYCFVGAPLHGPICLKALAALGFVVSILAFVWVINLVNFMDGLDGLAGSEAVCVASVCSLLVAFHSGFDGASFLFAVLAGAAIGFLIWNWPPARIFMGDAGSGFLGYSLGALSLLAVHRHELSIWTPVILLGVFAIDTTMTLFKRILRRERWYKPHRLHAFQHASRHFGHRNVTVTVIAINLLWLTPWAILAEIHPSWGPLLLLCAWAPLVSLAYLFHAGEVVWDDGIPRWRTIMLIAQVGMSDGAERLSDRLRVLVPAQMPLLCKALVLGALCLTCTGLSLLFGEQNPGREIPVSLFRLALLCSAGQLITLFSFGLHRCHWHLVSIEEIPNIVGMSLAANLAGVLGGLAITRSDIGTLPSAVFVLNALLLSGALVLAQISTRYLTRTGEQGSVKSRSRRVVIYGADAAGVVISSEIRRLGSTYQLLGFVDSRRAMKGVQIAGGRVLGAPGEIKRLVDTYNVDHVLVSSSSISCHSGRLFLDYCRSESVDFRVIPSLLEGIDMSREVEHQPSTAGYL